MKVLKKIAFVFAMVLLFSTSVHAASTKTTFNKGISNYKSQKYILAQKYFNKLPQKANEKCVKNMSSGMKRAYKNVVKSHDKVKRNGYITSHMLSGYYLTDIDKDGKAELMVKKGSCEAEMCLYIYKYINGKAKKIGTMGAGHTSYYQNYSGNGFYMMWAHQGYECVDLIQLKNNKLKTKRINERSIDYSSGLEYIRLPFELDGHIRWDRNYNRSVDYSPFK